MRASREPGEGGPRIVAAGAAVVVLAVAVVVGGLGSGPVTPPRNDVLQNGRLFFGVGETTSTGRLGVVGPDGQDPHLVPGIEPDLGHFDLAPDGSAIVVDHVFGSEIVPVAGGPRRTMFDASQPTWSPDGSEVAFIRDDGIWVASTAGGAPRRVTTGPDLEPAWSPDGTMIAFSRAHPARNCIRCHRDLFVVPATGGTPRRLTDQPRNEVSPRWSPTGDEVLYLSAGDEAYGDRGRLAVVSLDGSWRWYADDGPLARRTVSALTWSPDGRLIGLVFRGDVAVLAPGDLHPRVIADTGLLNDVLNTQEPQNGGRLQGDLRWEALHCTVTGTSGSDQLAGTEGDDVVCGLGGDDRITATPGHDLVIGGDGADVLSFANASAGISIDLGAGSVEGWSGGRVYGIEAVVGSAFDDSIAGSGGADRLEGGGGNDAIDAGVAGPRLLCGVGVRILPDGEPDEVIGGEGDDDITAWMGDVASGGAGDDRCLASDASGCEETRKPTVDRGPPLRPQPIVRRVNGPLLVMGPYMRRAILTGPDGEAIATVGPGRGYGAPEPDATWSPDGGFLAYVGGGRAGMIGIQHDFIYVSAADGSSLRKVTTGGPVSNPGWAADGRVTFMCEGDLWAVRTDGTGVRRVVAFDRLVDDPAVSPDGRWVAFRYVTDGPVKATWHIGVMPIGGGEIRDLTPDRSDEAWDPAWSPDGRWIAYSGPGGISDGLFVVPAAGGPSRRIADRAFGPSWSPDGRWILFGMGEEGANDTSELHAYRIHPDGTGLVLIRRGYTWFPRWQPGPVLPATR